MNDSLILPAALKAAAVNHGNAYAALAWSWGGIHLTAFEIHVLESGIEAGIAGMVSAMRAQGFPIPGVEEPT